MKPIVGMMIVILLSGCGASKYRYQTLNHPEQWQGQNISAVISKWGYPTDTLHTRSGVSYYVYQTTSGASFFDSTTTNFSRTSGYDPVPEAYPYANNNLSLTCTTTFVTNQNNIITNIKHVGSNCGGEWVPRKQ